MNTPPEPSLRPSLDDLLRLKRSERPDSDFWREFEQGMKQKQLAAIVEPKPWWLGYTLLARRFAPLAGVGLAGSAAMFAVVALRTASSVTPAFSPIATVGTSVAKNSHESREEATVASIAGPVVERVTASSRAELDMIPVTSPSVMLVSAESNSVAESASKTTENDGLSGLKTAGLLESATLGVVQLITPRAHPGEKSGSQNFSTVVSGVADSLRADTQFAYAIPEMNELGLAAPAPVDPSLAAADNDEVAFTNPRQARLLAAVTDSGATSDSMSLARVRDQVIHRMSEGESLYASISRLGVSGDRLSVKF